jgi:hypothetical protein
MKKLCLILFLLLFSICSFAQSRYISTTTKKIVYARDGGSCRCCGSSLNLEYDHITPFSCGGLNDVSNIQLLCKRCNRSKSNSCSCKIHNRIVGVNCCDRGVTRTGSSASTRRKSTSTASQCTGTTKKGARCRNRTNSANGRCYLH